MHNVTREIFGHIPAPQQTWCYVLASASLSAFPIGVLRRMARWMSGTADVRIDTQLSSYHGLFYLVASRALAAFEFLLLVGLGYRRLPALRRAARADRRRKLRYRAGGSRPPRRDRVPVGGIPEAQRAYDPNLVVAAGRGIGSKANMRLVEDLAAAPPLATLRRLMPLRLRPKKIATPASGQSAADRLQRIMSGGIGAKKEKKVLKGVPAQLATAAIDSLRERQILGNDVR